MSAQQIVFITLGCAKNEVDTDRMRALLLQAGFGETSDPATADLAIINTCSFLSEATQESVEATLALAESSADGVRSLPIVMCGCVPSRYGEDLARELPEVSAFVRSQDEDGIVEVVCNVLGIDVPAKSERDSQGDNASTVLRTVEGASAYVKISEGCDRFCTFCAIPAIRGRYASRDPREIVDEVTSLMERGVREIVLIGQDTGVWGNDLEEGYSLAWLLREVGKRVTPYSGWVRVLYLQPEGMTEDLISALRDTPSVLPYIDIPIQHCNERILHRMNRGGSTAELKDLFDRLRREIPGMVLRTTGLVGFPGETEDEFSELCDFIAEQGFDYCSVFAYSQEEGTAAAAMENQISDDIRLERAQHLQDIAETAGFAATAAHVGEEVDVIIDGIEDGDEGIELIGHAWFQAPDCDGAVHISSAEAAVGDKVRVKLVDAFCYELVGEVVEPVEKG